MDEMRQNLIKRSEQFSVWKRQNTARILLAGGFGGATLLAGFTGMYVMKHPKVIEWVAVQMALLAFGRADDFEERLAIYCGLPEPDLPLASLENQILEMVTNTWGALDESTAEAVSEAAALQLPQRTTSRSGHSTNTTTPKSKRTAAGDELRAETALTPPRAASTGLGLKWAQHVVGMYTTLESSMLLSAKSDLRQRLVREILESRSWSLEEKLFQIREVMPPSVERNVVVDEILDDASNGSAGSWLSREVLEANPPTLQATPCEASTSLMRTAITFFPGATNKLVLMLRERITCREVADSLATSSEGRAEIEAALKHLKMQFLKLHPFIQYYVLYEGIVSTITMLPKLGPEVLASSSSSSSSLSAVTVPTGSINAPPLRPYELYQRAIDVDLLGPLRRDAKISKSVLEQVKYVFLALPPFIQGRILLTAIEHPYANNISPTSDQQAELVRDLLSAGGIVAVKLAQMIAEDPRVPLHYRTMLGSLRDDNEKMGVAEMWHSVPQTVRKRIALLGRCLGVGSVKQVQLAQMEKSADDKHPEQKNTVAVGVLRRGVEEEALATLSALEASEDLQPVVQRLGSMVYGEFSLFNEGQALQEFAQTSITQNPLFKVVKVLHHSPKCLIESIAQGDTVAKTLTGVDMHWRDLPPSEHSRRVAVTMETLVAFHRTVLQAFVEDGIIHSDIHLGNVVLEVQADGSVKFVLFDVGQFERVGPAETRSLLWGLSWISTPERRLTLRAVALKHLVASSSLRDENHEVPKTRVAAELARRIEKAFEAAIQPFEDGSVPDKKTAWIFFLRNSEREGVNLPKGAFAIAKMMDGIVSQQASFDLPAVLDDTVEQFLKETLTWSETAGIVLRTAANYAPGFTK
jgi:predicted unusual protein kinase regulating ubiquinone biosynthesis (AarF/ABC1/UbiB family)